MECKSILLIVVTCLLVHVEFSEARTRKNRNIFSGFCKRLTTNACLMKIQNYSAGQMSYQVRINGSLTTDPATRFTIVKITTPAGKIGTCIEFTTGSQVKYALKVVTTTNIIFEKQQNGCHNNIANDFIFIEFKIPSTRFFTYTHNSKCLATDKNGALFLKSTNDASMELQCKYRHFTYQ